MTIDARLGNGSTLTPMKPISLFPVLVRGKDGDISDFPNSAGVPVSPVPIELVSRRPRLFLRDRALRGVGTSDTIPNVPTPNSKRNRAAVVSSDTEMDSTVHRGGGKRSHLDTRVFRVDIQSDN